MKKGRFLVIFKNNKKVFASAFSKEDAEILASSVMIKNGFTREIKEIVEGVDWAYMAVADFQT